MHTVSAEAAIWISISSTWITSIFIFRFFTLPCRFLPLRSSSLKIDSTAMKAVTTICSVANVDVPEDDPFQSLVAFFCCLFLCCYKSWWWLCYTDMQLLFSVFSLCGSVWWFVTSWSAVLYTQLVSFPPFSPGHLDSGRFEMRLSKISFSWPVPFLFFLSLLSFPPFHIPLHQLESNGNDSITYRWRGSVVWNDRWKFYDISGTGCHMMPSLGESAPFSELQSFWLVLLFSFFFLA